MTLPAEWVNLKVRRESSGRKLPMNVRMEEHANEGAKMELVQNATPNTPCGWNYQGLTCAAGKNAVHVLLVDLPAGKAGTALCGYHSPCDYKPEAPVSLQFVAVGRGGRRFAIDSCVYPPSMRPMMEETVADLAGKLGSYRLEVAAYVKGLPFSKTASDRIAVTPLNGK